MSRWVLSVMCLSGLALGCSQGGEAQLGAELTAAEVESVVTYLGSLTGEQPKIEYPILPGHTADTPLPDLSVGNGPAR